MSEKGVGHSVRKFLFIVKRKFKNLRLRISGKPLYTKKQFDIFNKLESGDLILGKMPMSDSELYDVPDGHRHRPYLVIKKKSDKVICLQGSHRQYSDDRETFKINIADFGQYNGDTFFSISEYYEIPVENINKNIGSLTDKQLKALQRMLMLGENKNKDAVHFENVDNVFKFGDIVDNGKGLFLIANDKNNALKGYRLTEKPIRNAFTFSLDNKQMYTDFYSYRNLKPEFIKLVKHLPSNKVSNLKRFMREGVYVRPGDVIKDNLELYYVFKTVKNEINAYPLSRKKINHAVKVQVGKKEYYVNVRKIVKFTNLRRDRVQYTLSEKQIRQIKGERKEARVPAETKKGKNKTL